LPGHRVLVHPDLLRYRPILTRVPISDTCVAFGRVPKHCACAAFGDGAPGEFAALTTETEVMDAVRKELGEAAANALLVSLADAVDSAEPELPEVEPRGPGDTLN